MALACSPPTSGWPRRSGSEGTPRSTSRPCSSTPSTIAPRFGGTGGATHSIDSTTFGQSTACWYGRLAPDRVPTGAQLEGLLWSEAQLPTPTPRFPAQAGPFARSKSRYPCRLRGTHVDNSFKHPPRSRQPTGCRGCPGPARWRVIVGAVHCRAEALPRQGGSISVTSAARIEEARRLMVENGMVPSSSSPARMTYLVHVRWGLSRRPFLVVLPCRRESARSVAGVRGSASPGDGQLHQRRARLAGRRRLGRHRWRHLEDRGMATGKVGIEERVRFFIAEGCSMVHRMSSSCWRRR